jgi:hypothetical protein
VELSEIAKVIGSLAGAAAFAWTLLTYFKSRGRLKVSAWLTDAEGSAIALIEDKNSLAVEAINLGANAVVLRNYNLAFRPPYTFSIQNNWEIRVSLLKSENNNDWVKIEPGFRHHITIPRTPNFITTEISAETSLGRVYKISLLNRVRIRLDEYRRLRRLRQNGRPNDPPRIPNEPPQVEHWISRD